MSGPWKISADPNQPIGTVRIGTIERIDRDIVEGDIGLGSKYRREIEQLKSRVGDLQDALEARDSMIESLRDQIARMQREASQPSATASAPSKRRFTIACQNVEDL